MKSIKEFFNLRVMLFVSALFVSMSGQASAGFVDGGDGCYYWNGNSNYLGIDTAQMCAVVADLETCEFTQYDGVQCVYATTLLLMPDGNVVNRNPTYFFGNGMYKNGFGGGYGRITIGDTASVLEVLVDAAS